MMDSLTRLYGSIQGRVVLTPRRVALAAAEACWEGLLGLPPVRENAISRCSCRTRWARFLRHLAVAYPWWLRWCSWRQTLSIVGVVVVGTVAGEVVVASRGTEKFEVVEIRYSPTTRPRNQPALGAVHASGIRMHVEVNSQTSPTHVRLTTIDLCNLGCTM